MTNTPLVVLLAALALVAALVTVWSLVWDLKAYRAWKREHAESMPRWKRRQNERSAQETETDASRWRWHILALQCAAFGLLGGLAGVAGGYVLQKAWLMISGGNLLFLGIMAWLAYNLILPKPRALREKKLPRWVRNERR